MSSTAAAVTIRGLTKRYGDTLVFEGLDAEVGAGEMVAVTGPSGCGKSTLLRIIGGLDLDYEGEVRVGDTSPKACSDRELARFRGTRVGMVFQSFNLLPHLSLLENVALPAVFAGRRGAQERALELLGAVGLAERAHDTPDRLSGGQAQRVAIARTLVNRPAVVLCDEPTGSLDQASADGIIALLRRINRDEGATVLLVTHHAEIAAAADRSIALRGPGSVREVEP